jgi:hypothetical protein
MCLTNVPGPPSAPSAQFNGMPAGKFALAMVQGMYNRRKKGAATAAAEEGEADMQPVAEEEAAPEDGLCTSCQEKGEGDE